MSEKAKQRLKERNQSEWENPKNWSAGVFGIYKSDRDTRLWAPKKNPKLGWTFNFAKPSAYVLLSGLIGVPLAFAAIVMVANILDK